MNSGSETVKLLNHPAGNSLTREWGIHSVFVHPLVQVQTVRPSQLPLGGWGQESKLHSNPSCSLPNAQLVAKNSGRVHKVPGLFRSVQQIFHAHA